MALLARIANMELVLLTVAVADVRVSTSNTPAQSLGKKFLASHFSEGRQAGSSFMLMSIPDAASLSSVHSAAEIDLELFTFVERYATTLFRWDLILFFGKHPDTGWTAAEIADRVHRNVAATTKELDDLTYLRVLLRHYTPQRTTYRLSRRVAIRRAAIRLADLEGKPDQPANA
jgi:hypothetical protein